MSKKQQPIQVLKDKWTEYVQHLIDMPVEEWQVPTFEGFILWVQSQPVPEKRYSVMVEHLDGSEGWTEDFKTIRQAFKYAKKVYKEFKSSVKVTVLENSMGVGEPMYVHK